MEAVHIGRHSAVGVHVFAGGFTAGVKDVFDVKCQVELHGLGVETTEKVWGVPVHLSPPQDWPDVDADMCFGNPRCTGFSCVTAGYSSEGHGPWARQCQDIHDLMQYAVGRFPVIVWESVQQAYSVGKPLLDLWTERLGRSGYRVAHVFVNAASFGNCQQRKRYFYVAYPEKRQFNVSAPDISPYYAVLWDGMSGRSGRETRPWQRLSTDYDQDCYAQPSEVDQAMIPKLHTGWCMNTMGGYDYDNLPEALQRKWDDRSSDMPFSMHSIFRPSWLRPCPTLKSSSYKLIHPWHHRPFTVGELADIMGWRGHYPVGPDPVHQIAKGIVPDVGTWLSQQVERCLDDSWGGEEWSCEYDAKRGEWKGEDTKGQLEKVCDVTKYCGQMFDVERYPPEAMSQHYRFNIDPATGRLIKEWKHVDSSKHRQPVAVRPVSFDPRLASEVA